MRLEKKIIQLPRARQGHVPDLNQMNTSTLVQSREGASSFVGTEPQL